MKTASFIICAAIMSVCGFADETSKILNESTYARLGVSALPTGNNYTVAPSVTYGKRALMNGHGIDISTNFSGMVSSEDAHSFAYSYSLPRITYLRFLEASDQNQLYAGIGSSLGANVYREGDSKQEFVGLMANGLIGYAIESKHLSSFVQFDCAKPLIPIYQSASPINNLIYEISIGLGF
ncbi:MAG: hypothetical protein HY860_04505 [Chlamydiales bacterium]|nr:hypothetical protein [Chlamydiales bacterium]